MHAEEYGVGEAYQIPDSVWTEIASILPAPPPKKKAGRSRMPDRQAMTAIFYLLRTGCQWKALPRSLGAPNTVHDRFQAWIAAGVFQNLWRIGVQEYDVHEGLDWEWQALDGALTKAPLGREKNQRKYHGSRQEGRQTERAG